MLWWGFWKRQSGEFCIGCNWIPCYCIDHSHIVSIRPGWAHSQRRVGVNITIPLHWPSCEWTLTLPIFLVCVRYQQIISFQTCSNKCILYVFLFHKCINIKYKTVNMYGPFLWLVQSSSRWNTIHSHRNYHVQLLSVRVSEFCHPARSQNQYNMRIVYNWAWIIESWCYCFVHRVPFTHTAVINLDSKSIQASVPVGPDAKIEIKHEIICE